MQTNEELKRYISTGNEDFNQCSLKLYLENSKKRLFSDHLQALRMFGFINHHILQCGEDVFAFVSKYEQLLEEDNITPAQTLLVCGVAIEFLKTLTRKSHPHYEDYYKDYVSYFQMVEEV